jgi:DNA-binding LacI/PurR family transcriptional regulator
MRQASPPSIARKTQPTLYDVSRLSGASIATVSRVFSGKNRVSEETRKRVIDAARELAFEPSHAARALAGRRTHTLGAIFPEIASGFYADVLAGIDEVAAESGFEVLASFVGRRRSRPEVIQRLLRQGRVDAIIVLNLDDTRDLDPAQVSQMPIVVIDHEINGAELPVVGMDNVGGAEAMIDHLAAQGHRRIGLLTGPKGNYDSEQRLMGCRAAMKRLGLTLDEQLIYSGAFTLESGAQAIQGFLASGKALPDAIFCFNDAMAIGALGELHRQGIVVPRDIALAGYDNVEAAAHLSLTTIACPMRSMGQVAARWAVELLTSGEHPTRNRLPVELVVRSSSAGKGSPPVLPASAGIGTKPSPVPAPTHRTPASS